MISRPSERSMPSAERRVCALWGGAAVGVAAIVAVGAARADTQTALGDRSGEGSTSFTSLAQAPEANLFTGALSTGISIDVPPGRKLATPNLLLQYSSQKGDSAFGHGWDLPIGRIERSTKWGAPRCGGAHFDEFVLTLQDVTAELVNDPPGSDTYRPKIEQSYVKAKVDKSGNRWTVWDRSGMRYELGTVATARAGTSVDVFPAGACTSNLHTDVWALTKIVDPNGNSIDIEWANTLNQLIPIVVSYGGNESTGLAHFFRVELWYEPRPDFMRSYRAGHFVGNWLRLQYIKVLSDLPSPATLVRRYDFYYDFAAPEYRSLLGAVETTGRPIQYFTYTPVGRGHAPAATSYSAPRPFVRSTTPLGEVSNTVMDMNGDGLLDYVHYPPGQNWNVFFGTNAGSTFGFSASAVNWSQPPPSLVGITQVGIRNVTELGSDCNGPGVGQPKFECTVADTFDMTGDGVPDYVVAKPEWSQWRVYKGRYDDTSGWGFETASDKIIYWNSPYQCIRYACGNETLRDVIDMDADGFPDLLVGGSPWNVHYSNGAGPLPAFQHGFGAPVSFAAPDPALRSSFTAGLDSGEKRILADFNGDGLPDLLEFRQGINPSPDGVCELPIDGTGEYVKQYDCMLLYFNTGSGFDQAFQVIKIPWNQAGLTRRDNGHTMRDLVDVNGDGLPDLVERREVYTGQQSANADEWHVLLNKGETLEPLVFSDDAPFGPSPSLIDYGYIERLWEGVEGDLRWTKTNGGTRRDLVDLVDLDGDGQLDRVTAGDGTGDTPTSWSVHFNRAGTLNAGGTDPTQRPNLLSMMDNGFGGTSTIVYRPSTRYDNTGADNRPDLPFVSWVVERLRQADGQCPPTGTDVFNPAQNACIAKGNEVVTKLRYEDGRFDAPSREFRGFRRVEQVHEEARLNAGGGAVDDRDNSVVTIFGQDDATQGRVIFVETYTGAACLGSGGNEPDCSQPVPVRTDAKSWRTTQLGNGRAQISLEWSYEYVYTFEGFPQYIYTGHGAPDAYGNIPITTKVNILGITLATIHTEFALPQSASGPQVFDRPSRVQVYDGSGVLEEKWFYYDGYTVDGDLGKVAAGNVRRVKSRLNPATPNGPETWTWYDAYGNVERVRDPNLHDIHTTYDPVRLHPYTVRDHLDHVITTETDYRWGRPRKVFDPNNALTEYDYDEAGRLKCVARPGENIGDCPVGYEYHFAGASETLSWVKVTEKQGPDENLQPRPPLWSQSFFDALGRTRHTDSFRIVEGLVATVRTDATDYDARGRPIRVFHPHVGVPVTADARRTEYYFEAPNAANVDPLSRVHRVVHADGSERRMAYNGPTTRTIDEAGEVTEVVRDPLGRVTQEVAYQTGSVYATTAYAYDGAGRLLSVSQNGSGTPLKTMDYDSLGRKTQMTDGDSGVWTYGYDAAGNMLWQNDPRSGQSLQFCYDELNRPLRQCPWSDDNASTRSCTSLCGNPGEEVRFFYDGNDGWTVPYSKGRMTRVEDASGQIDVEEYDARGRTRVETRTIDVDASVRHGTFEYAYDTNDRMTSTTYPDGEVVFTDYDHSGQPVRLRSISTQFYVIEAEYDRFGRPIELRHGNDVVDTRLYGDHTKRHRLTAMKSSLGATNHLWLDYQQYDSRGLLTQLRDQRDPSGEISNSADFAYDHMGRLLTFNHVHNAADLTFAYDALGNITRHGDKYFEHHAAKPHQVSAIRYGSPSGPAVGVQHDANGNRTVRPSESSAPITNLTYTREDRVASINHGGDVVQFAYDYQGRQTARLRGAQVTRYYSDLAETTGGTLTKSYFFSGQRVATRQTTNVAWEVAAAPAATWLAAAPLMRPEVVVVIADELHGAGALILGCVATGLIVAPWRRRRRVAGFAPRAGHAIGAALALAVGTLPWPLVIQPEAALAQKGGGAVIQHFHLDHLGSTQVITSVGGNIVEHIRYSAYGAIRNRWNGTTPPTPITNPSATGRYEFTVTRPRSAPGCSTPERASMTRQWAPS